MTFNPYRTTASSGFTRVAAYIVQHLLDDGADLQQIDELGPQRRPDCFSGSEPASRTCRVHVSDNRPLTSCRTKRTIDNDPTGCGQERSAPKFI
jgi:hypothetical protein